MRDLAPDDGDGAFHRPTEFLDAGIAARGGELWRRGARGERGAGGGRI
jgi:hypothetical protein